MPYSHFTLKSLEKKFNLQETVHNLFPSVEKLNPSEWLQQTLEKGSYLTLKTEKARSEMIIAPILLEMMDRNHRLFTLFSGETLEVDESQGLNGECDFILSKSGHTYTLQAPIFVLVEAKQHIIENSSGQCVAQIDFYL